MVNREPVSIGIIGVGGMGRRHALNLHNHSGAGYVSALYDLNPVNAAQTAAECGKPRVFDEPLALIHDDNVQAVLIASPDASHMQYVMECLRCRKPVLCEKPLATHPDDALKILETESALGQRLVSVGFMRRFDPQHTAVKRVLSSGSLGKAILYKGTHRNMSIPYSVSGEVIITNSSGHDVDAARWLLGEEVKEVYVCGVRSHAEFSADTTDLLLMQLKLSNDCLASIEVFVSAEYGYEVAAEVVGEHGTAVTAQPAPMVLRQRQSRFSPVAADWLERFDEAYLIEAVEWVQSIHRGQIFNGASAWDGFMALKVSEACIRSFRSGHPEAVSAPERPDFYRL
ncbi:MAG: Gfo/Idh/MocA family oxidoreductase [Anaerolineae bacterium]|nr:Gfo/Idh/MocA family oxidoreductase [Anaerolineae bacterium]